MNKTGLKMILPVHFKKCCSHSAGTKSEAVPLIHGSFLLRLDLRQSQVLLLGSWNRQTVRASAQIIEVLVYVHFLQMTRGHRRSFAPLRYCAETDSLAPRYETFTMAAFDYGFLLDDDLSR
jgi:hypothetical protein